MIGELIFWFETGKNNVIGRFQSAISLVLVVGTFLKVWEEQLGIYVNLEFLLLFGVATLVLSLVLGWAYCKSGIMKKEQKARYSENPQVNETHQAIQRIERQLKELGKDER